MSDDTKKAYNVVYERLTDGRYGYNVYGPDGQTVGDTFYDSYSPYVFASHLNSAYQRGWLVGMETAREIVTLGRS